MRTIAIIGGVLALAIAFGAYALADRLSETRLECLNPEEGMTLEDFTEVLGEPLGSREDTTPEVDEEGVLTLGPDLKATVYIWSDGEAYFVDGEAYTWTFLGQEGIC